DKANMDFNVEDSGTILKLLVNEGETVKLGAPVMIIGKAGEDIAALEAEAKGGGAKSADAKPAAKSDAKAAAGAKPVGKPASKSDASTADAVADGEKPPAAKADTST